MTNNGVDTGKSHSITFDEFMYFFLQLRKSRVREVVDNVRRQHPDETPEQLARRIIDVNRPLSLLGGSMLFILKMVPGVGLPLQALGLVIGSSVLTRMHLYMILEIALLYGRDIDDKARVSELMSVVGATGVSVAVSYVVNTLGITSLISIPVAGITSTITTQAIGELAIRHYSGVPLPEETPLVLQEVG